MPVYLIAAGDTDMVKIGWAKDVGRRIKSIQTGSPERLRVIRTIDGTQDVERGLHRHFSYARVGGEWFRFVAEMLTIEAPPTGAPSKRRTRKPHAGPIAEIVALFGGQSALARRLGISQGTVWDWLQTGSVPSFRIPQIITAGAKADPPIRLEPNDFFAVTPSETEAA